MEASHAQQGLYRTLQFGIYLSVVLELFLFFYVERWLDAEALPHGVLLLAERLSNIPFYAELIHSKVFTLVLLCLVSIGTMSQKEKELDLRTRIVYPLSVGILILFSGIWWQGRQA